MHVAGRLADVPVETPTLGGAAHGLTRRRIVGREGGSVHQDVVVRKYGRAGLANNRFVFHGIRSLSSRLLVGRDFGAGNEIARFLLPDRLVLRLRCERGRPAAKIQSA